MRKRYTGCLERTGNGLTGSHLCFALLVMMMSFSQLSSAVLSDFLLLVPHGSFALSAFDIHCPSIEKLNQITHHQTSQQAFTHPKKQDRHLPVKFINPFIRKE